MLEIPAKYLLINIETTIVFFGQTTIINNQNIFYKIFLHLKFYKRQKSLTYTFFANANLKRQRQNYRKNNNLNHK